LVARLCRNQATFLLTLKYPCHRLRFVFSQLTEYLKVVQNAQEVP
jgi:hypothetical protein